MFGHFTTLCMKSLKLDILLLADGFQNIRNESINYLELDPAQYFLRVFIGGMQY